MPNTYQNSKSEVIDARNTDVECPFQTVPDLLQDRARKTPDKNYVIFQDQPHTYRDFQAMTARFASSLAKLGVAKGDHIAVLLPNSLDFLAAFFGGMHAGAVCVTINTLLKADELEFIINDCDARVLITTPHYRKLLDPVWDELKNIDRLVLTDSEDDAKQKRIYSDAHWVPEMIAAGDPNFSVELSADDPAAMIYTSGTTGHPKGVVLTHGNYMYNSYVAPRYIDLQTDDVALCIMPLFHVNAQVASFLATLQANATVVLEEMFKPRLFIKTLKKYKCTTVSGSPAIYNFLNEMKENEGERLDFMKSCVCGSAPMPVEVFNKFEEKFGAKIIEGYGLSEGTCVSSLNPINGVRKIGSIGVPLDGQAMAIWDADGNDLPDGEIGEIVVSGPNVMRGYWKNPEASAKVLINGWLRTGDMGYRDQDGYYYISGRSKEMIIRGGENVYPKEIEEVLYQHDDVVDAAVIGIPDKTYGEEVAAFVILRPGSSTTDKEIKAFLRAKLADYKRPRVLELVHDLPRTATGKIQKIKIYEEYVGNLKLINRVAGRVHVPYHWVYGDALAKFYNGLRDQKFYGLKNTTTGTVQCPPKSYDALTFEAATEWVELPNTGTLESFTTVYMEFPGQPEAPPYTYGYIKLEGAHTHIYHLIREIPEDDIRIGLKVEAVWKDPAQCQGNLHDIQYFRPVAG